MTRSRNAREGKYGGTHEGRHRRASWFRCAYHGTEPLKRVVCPDCKGGGRVCVGERYYPDSGYEPELWDCSECGGLGFY